MTARDQSAEDEDVYTLFVRFYPWIEDHRRIMRWLEKQQKRRGTRAHSQAALIEGILLKHIDSLEQDGDAAADTAPRRQRPRGSARVQAPEEPKAGVVKTTAPAAQTAKATPSASSGASAEEMITNDSPPKAAPTSSMMANLARQLDRQLHAGK